MKFDTPATTNPIDQMKVVGQPLDRIDGPLKTTGTAPYAYERHDVAAAPAVWLRHRLRCSQGADHRHGRLGRPARARRAGRRHRPRMPARSTRASTTPRSSSAVRRSSTTTRRWRSSSPRASSRPAPPRALVKVDYAAEPGRFDLHAARVAAFPPEENDITGPPETHVGDFAGAFAQAPVTLDETYTTPDHSHAMMEPHATLAAWEGDQLTVWTSNQMIAWANGDLAKTLRMPKEKVRVVSPFIGGGFGGKLFLRADVVLAALGARAAGRPVKVALQRPLIANNTTHRPATIQRIRIGATREGVITAIGHESWSGDLEGGGPETAVNQTRLLYAGANRMTAMRLRRARPARGQRHARAGRGAGHDGAGDRHGRDGRASSASTPSSSASATTRRSIRRSRSGPFSARAVRANACGLGADRFGWDKRNPTSRPAARGAAG